MKTNYWMTTDLQVVEDYLGDAVIIAFDFETAPTVGWRDKLVIYQNDLESGGSRPVRVGKNAATNDLKAYLFDDLGLPVLKINELAKRPWMRMRSSS